MAPGRPRTQGARSPASATRAGRRRRQSGIDARAAPFAAPVDGAGSNAQTPDASPDAAVAVCNHAFRLDGHNTASQVLLTGDFVQWAAMPPGAVAFTLGGDGAWTGTYPFEQGTWQYK